MPGISISINGNAQQFEKEVERTKQIAKKFKGDFSSALTGGPNQFFHGINSGWLQIIHSMRAGFDSIVSGAPVGRVLAQQIPQIAQGLVLLGNKIPGLGLLIKYEKDAATASETAAAAFGEAAIAANNQAIASAKKAVALTAALYAEDGESEAALAAAVAAEEKAAADAASAAALRAKAIAAAEAAAAQRAETGAAKLSIGPLGILLGILTGIAAGGYVAFKQTSALISRLAGIQAPDFKPEYIAKHLQKVNQGLELQKRITREMERQRDLYNSSARLAERVSDATKSHYDHLRKMNSLSHLSDDQKKIREFQLNVQERNAGIANLIDMRTNLLAEGRQKQQRAASLLTGVSSNEHDQELVKKNKALLDAADEAMKNIASLKDKNNPLGISKDEAFKAYNRLTDSGISAKDLDAADRKVASDRKIYEAAYKNSVNQMASNSVIREQGKQFGEDAAAAFSKAVEITKELPDKIKANQLKNRYEASELYAEITKGKGNFDLTENQRIGAFSLASMQVLDVNKMQLLEAKTQTALLKSLDKKFKSGVPGY